MSAPVPASDPDGVYAKWVRTLRAWRSDPNTDLSGLPSLDAQSFHPATFDRLFAHLTEAVGSMMERWSSTLADGLARARDDFEVSAVLSEHRTTLSRRRALAWHPGLPEEVRRVLDEGFRRDVTRIQRQLEQDALRSSDGGRTSRADGERFLKLLRATSFTALLEHTMPGESTGSSERHDPPRPSDPPELAEEPAEPRTASRRVFLEDA